MKYPEGFLDKIICVDCLEIMPELPEKSIDMILCDLSYRRTIACSWDTIILFELLWKEYQSPPSLKEGACDVVTMSKDRLIKLNKQRKLILK